jgi:hypothetical protein
MFEKRWLLVVDELGKLIEVANISRDMHLKHSVQILSNNLSVNLFGGLYNLGRKTRHI